MASRSQVSVHGAKTIITRITDGHHDEDESVHALYEASVTSADYAEGVRGVPGEAPATLLKLSTVERTVHSRQL